MSLNSRFAIDQELTTKRFGKNFHTIDFEMNDYFNKENYIYNSGYHKKRKCGTFFICNKRVDVSMKDLNNIKHQFISYIEKLFLNKPETRLSEIEVEFLNYTFHLTKYEIERVLETAENALGNIEKSYVMGLLPG